MRKSEEKQIILFEKKLIKAEKAGKNRDIIHI